AKGVAVWLDNFLIPTLMVHSTKLPDIS
ncbi:hypothetical protein A2U01_0101812, partial [Trifolium medium]|nr:hypothetical protein [Trifolium medium]